MKKLLLAALLAVGATSFGAEVVNVPSTEGKTTTTLPITVRGKLVAPTDLQLVVTPTVQASADSRGLDFNLGDIILGVNNAKPAIKGEFTVELLNSTLERVPFIAPPTMKLKGGVGEDSHKTLEIKDAQEQHMLVLDYKLETTSSGNALYKGAVVVDSNTTGNDGATVGYFTATDVDVEIEVTNQKSDGTEADPA